QSCAPDLLKALLVSKRTAIARKQPRPFPHDLHLALTGGHSNFGQRHFRYAIWIDYLGLHFRRRPGDSTLQANMKSVVGHPTIQLARIRTGDRQNDAEAFHWQPRFGAATSLSDSFRSR